MYTDTLLDINRPADSFDDWAMSLDTWLDTPDGIQWLKEQEDAFVMSRGADRYGERPC